MNERVRLADRKELTADIDSTSGDLVYLKDNTLDLVLIDQPPLWELQVNRQVQGLELKMHEDRRGLLQTIARTRHFGGYAMGWELSVGRLMVPGPSSLHIQYRIKRVRLSERYPVPGPNPHESEMPLYLDTLGFLGWRFALMREETRMRVAHLGAAGPAEHVGFDDGPIASVLPKVQHLMRRTYPGVMTIPGALYYNPSDETWFCVTSRRSKLAWTADFNEHGMQFFPQYHKLLPPDGEFYVPEFSIQWGRGRISMESFWNGFFDAADPAPDWMNHTVWAMMDYHSAYSNGQMFRPGPFSFRELGESAEACIEAGGANGFWFYTHDIRRSDSDTSPYSMAPSPDGGTRREFTEMVKRIRGAGGRSLIWMSTAGLNPRGDLRPEWASRGVDGRPYTSWGFDAHEFITACNPLKPGFRQYFLDWIRRYVENYDVDGFFFDCGVFAHPCDFSPDFTADHFAGEAGPAMRELYLEAWELIQSIKPGQVHLFHEGVHADFPGSGYMVCGMNQTAAPGELTLQGQMSRFERHGQGLNWSSFTPFDLQSGFVHWNPVAGGTDREALLQYAADPMNQLVCRLVREKGVADARYLRDGASLLGNVIVTVPGYRGSLAAAGALEGTETLEHALTGERVVAVEGCFSLTGKAAYRMIK